MILGFNGERHVWQLRELVNEDVRDGGVVLVVSLDTTNALSLPWPVIKQALEDRDIPEYLRCILGSYLSERDVMVDMKPT